MNWYAKTAMTIPIKETFIKYFDDKDAANAKITDLNMMAGRTAIGGIPNNNVLMSGERIAVKTPTNNPYLYAAIKVKK